MSHTPNERRNSERTVKPHTIDRRASNSPVSRPVRPEHLERAAKDLSPGKKPTDPLMKKMTGYKKY